MRKRIRGLVALAVVLGAALLLVGNASPTGSGPIDVSKAVAKKYVAAATARSAMRVGALFASNAVEIDTPSDIKIQGRDSIVSGWDEVFRTPGARFQGKLTCAGPGWAVVSWRLDTKNSMYAGGTVHRPGVSILQIANGKIARETLYYETIDTR